MGLHLFVVLLVDGIEHVCVSVFDCSSSSTFNDNFVENSSDNINDEESKAEDGGDDDDDDNDNNNDCNDRNRIVLISFIAR